MVVLLFVSLVRIHSDLSFMSNHLFPFVFIFCFVFLYVFTSFYCYHDSFPLVQTLSLPLRPLWSHKLLLHHSLTEGPQTMFNQPLLLPDQLYQVSEDINTSPRKNPDYMVLL